MLTTISPVFLQPFPDTIDGAKFVVRGWVPKKWLYMGGHCFDSVGIEIFNKKKTLLFSTSVGVEIDWLFIFRKKIKFSGIIDLTPASVYFENGPTPIMLVVSGMLSSQLFEGPTITIDIAKGMGP